MCTYVIESHMREEHPHNVEVVFVLSAAENVAMLAHGERKTKKVHALNQEFKAPEPLHPAHCLCGGSGKWGLYWEQ